MRTGCSLTVSRGGLLPGGGASFLGRGGLLPGGSASRGGCLLLGGVCFRGGLLLGGSIPACTEADPPINSMTDTSKNITLATTSLRPVIIITISLNNYIFAVLIVRHIFSFTCSRCSCSLSMNAKWLNERLDGTCRYAITGHQFQYIHAIRMDPGSW